MKKLVSIIAITAAMFSCSKNQLESPSPSQPNEVKLGVSDVQITDGILTFQSKEHLKNVVQELSKSKKSKYFDGNQGFVSMLTVRNKISETEMEEIAKNNSVGRYKGILSIQVINATEKRIVAAIDDDVFASVLSKDGVVVIGQSAYKIIEDKIYSYNLRNSSIKMTDFIANSTLPNVKVEQVKQTRAPLKLKGARVLYGNAYYESGGRDYRFYGDFASNDYGFYSNARVCVHHEKYFHGWFGTRWWGGFDAPNISFSYTGSLYETPYISNFPANGDESGSYTSGVDNTVNWGFGGVTTGWNWASGNASCLGVDYNNHSFSF